MATREQILTLEACWVADPIFDLAEEPGFEEHKEELRAFQARQDTQWMQRYQNDRRRRMVARGLEGNERLFEHLERMEKRLALLETQLYGEE